MSSCTSFASIEESPKAVETFRVVSELFCGALNLVIIGSKAYEIVLQLSNSA